jgi:hypothetical protein
MPNCHKPYPASMMAAHSIATQAVTMISVYLLMIVSLLTARLCQLHSARVNRAPCRTVTRSLAMLAPVARDD